MSWLFDRLTDLAVSDHLTIVIDAPTAAIEQEDAAELARMLRRAQSLAGTSVCTSLSQRPLGGAGHSSAATFLASASAAGPELFAALDAHDLGVSVGGAALGATMQVDAVTDLSSLLDALITLRSYAQRAVA